MIIAFILIILGFIIGGHGGWWVFVGVLVGLMGLARFLYTSNPHGPGV